MEFELTEEQRKFKQEIREYLEKELPPGWTGGSCMDYPDTPDRKEWELGRVWDKKLAERGWLTMCWPKEYGGMGRSCMDQLILSEALYYYRVPCGGFFGILLAGPTLMVHGTEEQKREHLDKIAKAEGVWCQLFTEPDAGSDLASLQCQATKDGEDYIINGRKHLISYAHWADWGMLLARTDPKAEKHKGISFFLVDMKTPGITVVPQITMTGGQVDEVFFVNVRVSKRNLVGEENRGFYIAMTTLTYERGGIIRTTEARRLFDDLVKFAKETQVNGRPLAKDPIIRNKLAQMKVEVEVGMIIAYRMAWLQDQGIFTGYELSVGRAYVVELLHRVANAGMQILGPYGSLKKGSKGAVLSGKLEHICKYAAAVHLMGGSKEIVRNIIATRGLGLPRI